MTKKLLRIITIALILIATATPLAASAKGWEAVRSDVSAMKSVAHENELEIKVSPGQIVVSTQHQTQIKIFTILGQVVSSETVPAGVSRLSLAHGIYIVKAGDLTCKVVI